MTRAQVLAIVAAGMLAGCASTKPDAHTPRRMASTIVSSPEDDMASRVPAGSSAPKPEVVARHASRKEMRDALTEKLVTQGWSVAQTNEYQVVYEIDAKLGMQFLSSVFMGFWTQAVYRMTTQFLETPDGVRTIGGLEFVSNPGSPRTYRTALNSGKSREWLEATLEDVRAIADGRGNARYRSPAPVEGP